MRTISQVMSRDVTPVKPGDSVEQTAQIMSRLDVGLLPVCDGHRLLGVVTHRDIVRRGIADGKDSRNTQVSDIMSSNASSCFEDQQIDDVLVQMAGKQIHHLPVVDRQQQLVGMISLQKMAGQRATTPAVDETQFSSDWRRAIEPDRKNMPHKIGYNADDDSSDGAA